MCRSTSRTSAAKAGGKSKSSYEERVTCDQPRKQQRRHSVRSQWNTRKGDRSLPIGQPFLRWAGSKRKLLPRLLPFWGEGHDRYIEPFAGSAALFFAIQPKRALLSDINPDLIQALGVIRNDPAAVY